MTEQLGDPAPIDGASAYEALPRYAALRYAELSRMLASFVSSTEAYGSLISRLIWAIGDVPTTNVQDRVIRDLASDVFDFLVATRRSIIESQLAVSYPLARRAYESLSLLAVCIQDASLAERWHGGAQISNIEVRNDVTPVADPAQLLVVS